MSPEHVLCLNTRSISRDPPRTVEIFVQEFRIFVKTSKPRQTRARLGNEELADEAELVSLAVG